MVDKKIEMKDVLKRNLPAHQKNNKSLDEFLDAAGEFLQRIKEEIESFDSKYDFAESSPRELEKTIEERGTEFPRALPEDVKRKFLRDVSAINSKHGTLDGMRHSLSLIGFDAEVRQGWIYDPEVMQKGYIRDNRTDEVRTYDINPYLYTELLFGNETVTEDGTFLEGYNFFDTYQENKTLYPILGEKYDSPQTNTVRPVSKTPYLIVRFTEGNFNASTGSYVDPETGEVYEYTFREEFELINEIVGYFTRQGNRPSTMRVIVIVTVQEIEELLDIESEFEQANHEYTPDGGDIHEEDIPIESDFLEDWIVPSLENSEELQTTAELVQENYEYTPDGGDTHEEELPFVEEFVQEATEPPDQDFDGEFAVFVEEFSLTINDEESDVDLNIEMEDIFLSKTEEIITDTITVSASDRVVGSKELPFVGEYSLYKDQFTLVHIPTIGDTTIEANYIENWPQETRSVTIDESTYYPMLPRTLVDLTNVTSIEGFIYDGTGYVSVGTITGSEMSVNTPDRNILFIKPTFTIEPTTFQVTEQSWTRSL